MRFISVIAAAWLALAGFVATSHAERRVALVVGNAAYRHADKLANPVSDAQGVRDALKKLGFDVIYGENLDQNALRRAIGQFAGRVDGADAAIIYFAGHGATFGDTPYVVPVDAEFASLDEVPYQLVAVETLIGELRRAKGVRIALLDACRDNAAEQELKRQASRGGPATRGLAPMKNPSGLIIAYATQYLATAADDSGGGGLFSFGSSARHSPFTAALLNNIATPGLDVTDMLRKVGREVDIVTGGKQRPEISISMYEQYALAPGAASPENAPRPAVSAPVSDAAQAWAAVQNTTSLAVLDDFILHYGNAPVYGALARARREDLARKPPPAIDPQVAMVDVPVRPNGGGPLTAAQERGLKPKDTFRECENCPEMVVVPAGSFTMGSPEGEGDRTGDESPQHVVTIGKPFAVGKLHVTVDQFAAFVQKTGYRASSTCWTLEDGKQEIRTNRSWRSPGFAQEGSHPVVCVSWNDAKAYGDWLAKETGKPYRLLTESEWEYAARGRTSPGAYPRFWFGDDIKALCRYGNGADQKARDSLEGTSGWTFAPCNDGYVYTSPAGHYQANAFDLYDMAGNAWQWTADCYHDSYKGAPADGSAWTPGTCSEGRLVRGGAWYHIGGGLRAANRFKPSTVYNFIGFRLARTLTP